LWAATKKNPEQFYARGFTKSLPQVRASGRRRGVSDIKAARMHDDDVWIGGNELIPSATQLAELSTIFLRRAAPPHSNKRLTKGLSP
jgi:hypothetical protein